MFFTLTQSLYPIYIVPTLRTADSFFIGTAVCNQSLRSWTNREPTVRRSPKLPNTAKDNRILTCYKGLLLPCVQHQEEREFFACSIFRLRARTLLARAMRYPFLQASEYESVFGEFLHVELQWAVVRKCCCAWVGAWMHLYLI